MDAVKTGALIAQTRKEKGLTQRELAEKVYVSVQAVSKWELGKNFPDLSLMEPLSDALGLSVSELLAGERGEAPRDELVRDTLRLGEEQLRPKIRRWRGLFLAAAILLALTALYLLGMWQQEHTVKPQPETIVEAVTFSKEEQAMFDLLNNQGDGMPLLHMYNVTMADDMDSYRLILELWTHDGLEERWPIINGHGFSRQPEDDRSRLLSFRIPLGEDGGSRYKVSFGPVGVSGPADELRSLPYMDNGSCIGWLTGPAVADREQGIILVEIGLSMSAEAPQPRNQLLYSDNDPQPGTLLEGTASLILKLYWD